MPDQRRRGFRPVHLLAPLALVAVAVAVAVVIANSDVTGGDDDNGGEAVTTQGNETETSTTPNRQRRLRRNYVVRPGDSFGSIADRFGVSIEQLEQLNPEVDPQALVVGQRIRLRE
jgi:LysM repeat protein